MKPEAIQYGFGLEIHSNEALPFWPLAPQGPVRQVVKIEVQRSPLPPLWLPAQVVATPPRMQIIETVTYGYDRFTAVSVPSGDGVVRAWIREDLDLRILSLALSGVLASVLWLRRDGLPIHCGGVVEDGGARLILGKSGSGKSTATAQWVEDGAAYLGDDRVMLEGAREGTPTAIAALPFLRLLPDSIQRLGLRDEDFPWEYPQSDKRVVWLRDHWTLHEKGSAPLQAVFHLRRASGHDAPEYPTLRRLAQMEAAALLHRHLFGHLFLPLADVAGALIACVRVAAQVPMFDATYAPGRHNPSLLVLLFREACAAGLTADSSPTLSAPKAAR